MQSSPPRDAFRFRDYELNIAGYELRRNGRKIKLGRQPMDVLILLVERRGQLVSRSDIAEHLWGKDVFVDIETGVNTAVSKVRQALHDSADVPVFVETVSGRGYRFIAAIEDVTTAPAKVLTEQQAVSPLPVGDQESRASVPRSETATGNPPRANRVRLAMGLTIALMLTGFISWMWGTAIVPASHVTLAVLPFENLGNDPDRDYVADGLTEEMNASLGQIDPERLSVIGRTSMLRYKHTTKSIAEIGRELGIDYLVESSVRAEGPRFRVTAKLIRVRDQLQIWSQSFEREPTSLLGLQQELSAAVAEQIRLRLSPERLKALAQRHSKDAEAYDLYLRGRQLWKRLTLPTSQRAIEYYSRATALDPDYGLAWSGIADAYSGSPINGDAPPLQVRPRASDAVAQAVRATPDLAESQASLALFKFYLDWDWPAAETALRRATALDPNYPMGYRLLGLFLSHQERHDEAKAAIRRARELDPFSAPEYAFSAQVAFSARDYSSAILFAQQAIVIDPEFWIGHLELAQAYTAMGKHALALEALGPAQRVAGGNNSKWMSLRGYLLAELGRTDEARELLKVLEAASHDRYIPPFAVALVYAGLGDREAVFKWLDQAYAARDVHLAFLPIDSKWDPYRSDPRFTGLIARCNFMRVPGPEPSIH